MKLIRLEDWNGEPLKYDCTPEELAEAYRLARESFTAADLQKYTEPFDDFVPADDVLRARLLQFHQEQLALGRGQRFVDAYREIVRRLQRDPRVFGEELYTLPT